MKKRYAYSLLFGVPGFFVSVMISLFAFGAVAGVLWIFAFGDNPWPSQTDTLLPILFAIAFLPVWIGIISIGFVVGRKLEKDPVMNNKHLFISGALTILFIVLIVLQPWSVGNLGPKSASVICSYFCAQMGYSGSGMPPQNSGDRSCSCFDNSGNEVLTMPLDKIDPDASK